MQISETNASALNRPLPRPGLFAKIAPQTEHIARILPDKPENIANLNYKDGAKSVFSRVLKGERKTKCQDATLFSVDGDHFLIGVLDGFGANGDYLPVMVGDGITKYWNDLKQHLSGSDDLKKILFDAAAASLRHNYHSHISGGTTAIIASVSPDNRYLVASVGDSVCYHIDRQGNAKLLLNHDQVVLPFNYMKIQGSAIGVQPEVYAWTRNFLATSISSNFGLEQIETTEGVLGIGERLILVSDGITKNLFMRLDMDGKLLDTSGCFDLERLIRGKDDVESAGEMILNVAKTRALAKERRTRFHSNGGVTLLPADDDMSVVVMGRD